MAQTNTALKQEAAAPYWTKSYAPGVPAEVEIPAQPLTAFLAQTAARFGDRDAIAFAGHTYTYKTFAELVARVACGLQGLGVKKGMKIGLFMPNSGYSVVMYYAIMAAGGTVVNYNPVYVERDLINQVEDSETDILVTLDAQPLLDKARLLLDKTRVRRVIVAPARENMTASTRTMALDENHIWFCDLIDNDGRHESHPVDFYNDIAVLQYTGGTTGVPKGAALTHQSVVSNAVQMSHWYHTAEEGKDSMIAVLPLFHVFAMTVVMNMPVMKGLKMHIMPQFSMQEMLELIERERPAYLVAVPTIYTALANYDKIGNYDFSSLKFCLSGGAPLPVEVKSAFEQRTKARLVAEGYGLTEFSPVVTCSPHTEKARAGSIGLPIPNTIVEIVSLEDGETVLGPNEKGEVCARGPQAMQGYYNKPEETAKVMRQGRLHTGDVGYMDEDGFVYIVDRVKDMILVGGYNVYPRHVEEAIYMHPAVAECIVAGVPDKMRGETVWAWVKPKDNNPLDAERLKAFLADKLSPIEMPRKIIIRDQPLPKTAVGKLSKKDLLEQEGIRK